MKCAASTFLNSPVEVVRDVPGALGVVVLRAGLRGIVVWDEPDGDVVVRFEEDVSKANGGYLLNKYEAWVMRSYLKTL